MSLGLLLVSAGLFALSGLPPGRLGPALALTAGLTGLAGAMGGFVGQGSVLWDVSWAVPGSRFSLGLDALGAAFLLPVLVVPSLGALYAHGYVPTRHPTAHRTRLAYALLPASMVLVVLARDAFLFLVAWEMMALSAFFAVSADDHDPEVRASGWVYLVATHFGTLCLIAAFGLLARHTGTLALVAVPGDAAARLGPIALLFLVGFGMKAGLMPLHLWLPGAHANAPSHVSAVMSGVVLKMGVYGLVRMASLLGDLPTAAGGVLLCLGAVGALLGAALAVAQSDLKRLLAYSSVDNMAIAVAALGLAVVGRATGRHDLVVLGVAGAVLHVWNHALFKSLLFFVAGAVVHAAGTRQLDRMGGLGRAMPLTAGAALLGALALAGLPPLNGFLGELLIYVGLARSATGPGWPALAAPALAATGALAVVAMVKVHAGVFLGVPRTAAAATAAHDPPASMRAVLLILGGACVAVVIGAVGLAPVLDRVVAAFARAPAPRLDSLLPLGTIALLTAGGGATVALAVAWWVRPRSRARGAPTALTWDCGYHAPPTPRLQYTPTSFSQIASDLFHPVVGAVRTPPTTAGVFPPRGSFTERVPEPVLDRVAVPALALAGRSVTWLRLTQQGKVQVYLLYILAALLLLLWVA